MLPKRSCPNGRYQLLFLVPGAKFSWLIYFSVPETDGVDASSGASRLVSDEDARPALATHIKNLNEYDVVFVGFPNWWYDMPQPLYTFFDEYDFSGKTVVPFCTHGGSRFSDAIKTIREMEKGATVLDGYAIARDRVSSSKDGIQNWLKKIGMTE